MDAQDISLIKGLIAKVNALEKVMLETDTAEKYIEYRKEWLKDLDGRIGSAYLQQALDEPDDPDTPA